MTETTATADTEMKRLKALLVSSTRLSDEAVALARALGPDASGAVVAEIIDAPPTLTAVGSAMRAAFLARELGLGAAVAPFARFVERWGARSHIGRHAAWVLSGFGPAAADALFGLLDRTRDPQDRARLTEALACSCGDDERIRAHLVRLLEERPAFAATLLAERGDWRAVPDLLRAFDLVAAHPIAHCDICAADDLTAMGGAVMQLGGKLSAEQSAQLEEALHCAERGWTVLDHDWAEHLAAPTPAARGPRPGRNDPCPCGSGKKYKRCCLDADGDDARH